jgi:hypothetical protein
MLYYVKLTDNIVWIPPWQDERQWNVNDFRSCIMGNLGNDWRQQFINEDLAGFTGKTENDTLPAPFWWLVSTERQRIVVLYVRSFKSHLVITIHNLSISHLHRRKIKWHAPCPIMKISVNWGSMIFSLVSWVIDAQWVSYCLYMISRLLV